MTLELKKSEVDALPFNFEEAVQSFIAAKMAHRFTGDAAPVSHPIVEMAVRRVQYPIDAKKPDDFVADYVIIDDTPILTLAEKKAALVQRLRQMEAEKINAVITPGRLRLLQLKVEAIGPKLPEEQTEEEKTLIAQLNQCFVAIRAVQMRSAEIEADIDDLSANSIDAYELPAL